MVKYGNLDLKADIYISNANWDEKNLETLLEDNEEIIYKKIKPHVNQIEILEGIVDDHELKYRVRLLINARCNKTSSSWDFDGKAQEENDIEYSDIEGKIQKELSSECNVQIDIRDSEFLI